MHTDRNTSQKFSLLRFFPGKVFHFYILVSGLLWSCSQPQLPENGMVVSASTFASSIGVEVMKNGGNAFDAATAVGFALAVVAPEAGNIGGGGFLVGFTTEGEPMSLDFREKAPARAHQDMYLDNAGNVINGLSLNSHLASGVPGTVDGLLSVFRSHGSGKLPLHELLAPAIALAKHGFPIGNRLARLLNENRNAFQRDAGASNVFIRKDGRDWLAGDTLIQSDLAETLSTIAEKGREGFYSGSVADKIVREVRSGGGWITKRDLKNYSSIYRAPVWGRYGEYDIFSIGPPSSGGPLLIEMLNMFEASDIPNLEVNSAPYIHLLTEIQRRAFADRSEYFGDPDFFDVPLDSLTSKPFAERRISDINPDRKTHSHQVKPADIPVTESSETTHYSIADGEGNCVSVTYTLNLNFGSKILVDGAGFLLNNEMDDFSGKPGTPNHFGLIGHKGNAIQGGKRPLSSMTPTIILKNGEPFLILGSPGGSRIITNVLQVVLNILEFEMPVADAVASKRFHSQWIPDLIHIEEGVISRKDSLTLVTMGHVFETRDTEYFGAVNAVLIQPEGFSGGPDPRRENSARGY